MKANKQQLYSRAQALSVAAALIEKSRWFHLEPWPFDQYLITVKADAALPEPWAAGQGTFPVCASDRPAPSSTPADFGAIEVGSASMPRVKHPLVDYTLADAIALAMSNAWEFGQAAPRTLADVREYVRQMAARVGSADVWMTGAAALDVLDAAIDGKNLLAGCRVR